MESDAELLQTFLDARSEAAFTALVQRHLSVVYGAALRRVGGDTHRAQDVAQEVFTKLAQKAASLRSHPALTGWLYTTTNNIAAKTMRTEFRRAKREDAARAFDGSDDFKWHELKPVIDEALLDLPEGDRVAILLRFFHNESYPAVGVRLGLTDNGARMRTERALESLRGSLAKRGISSTAAALGGALSAHGAVAVPLSVVTAIASNAVAASAAGGGLLVLFGGSTLKAGAVVAALAAGATGMYWQSRANNALRSEVTALRTELADDNRRAVESFRGANVAVKSGRAELDRLHAEIARMGETPPPDDAIEAWALRMANLRLRMASQPDENIPEMRFLTEDDWLDASKAPLASEEDYRTAMAKLRAAAEGVFGQKFLQPALKRYLLENGNEFPASIAQLQPYFSEPVEPAILLRWDVFPAAAVGSVWVGDRMISEKMPVAPDYDSRRLYGAAGSGSTRWNSTVSVVVWPAGLEGAADAYRAANNGRPATTAAELVPYASTPEQQAILQKLIARAPAP